MNRERFTPFTPRHHRIFSRDLFDRNGEKLPGRIFYSDRIGKGIADAVDGVYEPDPDKAKEIQVHASVHNAAHSLETELKNKYPDLEQIPPEFRGPLYSIIIESDNALPPLLRSQREHK